MSTYMGRELELLVQSMICGALLVLVYDGDILFSPVLRHFVYSTSSC